MKPRHFIPLLLIAVGICAYHDSFRVPFLFDDQLSIEENQSIRHLWAIGKVLSPSPTSLVGGRPVVNLSLAVNYALGRGDVRGYHVFNLAVHLLAGLTLYGIVRRTLLQPGLRERFGPVAERLALAVALFWVVHPLQTEAVTYISQRCESLMGLFYLLTLYAFIRGVESARSAGWFGLSVAACFLGMASKEVMVTAPVMTLLYDRTFVSCSFREAWARRRRLYLALAGSWLFLSWLMVGLSNRKVGYGLGCTWWEYALTECRVVVQYLGLAIWPHPLVFDYGLYIPNERLVAALPYALVLAILVVGVLLALRARPAVGFIGACFFVVLAPTSSVVPIVGSPMAEHRMYLPLVSVVALEVVGAYALGKRVLSKAQGIALASVAGGAVTVALTLVTIQRNQDYRSALAIWQDTVEKRPDNPRAQSNLGVLLADAGDTRAAIRHCKRAVEIYPDYAVAHNNLGVVLAREGRTEEAIRHYERAVEIDPHYADAHNNFGNALAREGKLREAIEHLEEALRLQPDDASTHDNFGDALLRAGRVSEAVAQFERALQLKPDFAEAHYNLGIALQKAGDVPGAIGHYEQALRIKPDYAEAHDNIGLLLARVGRMDEAVQHLERALQLKPDDAALRSNLGNILARAGRMPQAIEQYKEALRIKPNDAGVHNNLGNALLQTGNASGAVAEFEQALHLKPDFAEAHYNLGVALEKLGRASEAKQHYQEALRMKPDFAPAREALARARQ
ncbi:MAG TPA: tetratricopeptide repeat protein [Verrucomicrobiae bacterium]|nr:tetratricopeptide repeat protein [Verrucomicrobiae bacterium]